ncbi:MAG TPA: DUF2231 domain-containing protein [Gemmatimonadaceae bacterium]|nr:DUF2231 domain-containing protein [Gemmatimonadaceae bacterium]
MLPDPLHPAVVHFPVVLAFLLPLFVGGSFWAMRRGASARRAWLLPVVLATAVAGSAWLSTETGEAQGERVERVVSERAIETHEEVAEAFLTSSVVVAVIAAAGLIGGLAGRLARLATVAGSLVLAGVVTKVGHTGGQLVYRYGAAGAYTNSASAGGTAASSDVASGERGALVRPGDDDDR